MSELKNILAKNISFGIIILGAFPASFAAMSVNDQFVGNPSLGTLQGFALSAALFGLAAYLYARAGDRHRAWARFLTWSSVFAILSLIVFVGKVNQLVAKGSAAAKVAFIPTLVVLVAQLGLALVYRYRANRGRRQGAGRSWLMWGPPVALIPVFLVLGSLGHGLFGNTPTEFSPVVKEQAAARAEPAQEKFTYFPKPEDYPFARETDRAGEDSGGSFAHYHTGQVPLVGVAYSTRSWHRRTRLSKDLRGIFDPEVAVEAEHSVLARPGYVVVGARAQIEEYVEAIQLQFARLDDTGLDMADTYESKWLGEYSRGERIVELGGNGELVLGLVGTSGLVVNSLGLLVADSSSGGATR